MMEVIANMPLDNWAVIVLVIGVVIAEISVVVWVVKKIWKFFHR